MLRSLMELRRRPLESIVDLASELGPVFRLRVGGGDVTVVAGPGGQDVVRDAERLELNREGIFDAFSREIGIDIFSAQGQRHDDLRSLVQLGYSRSVAAAFAPRMAELVREEARRWREGERLRLYDAVGSLAVRQMMLAVTPVDLSARVDDFVRYGQDVMSVIGQLKRPAAFWNPLYRRARNRCWRELDAAIPRHRAAEFASAETTWMLDAFLLGRTPTGGAMNDFQVRAAASYALAGAHVYMGPLVTFMLYEALRNRRLLEELRREVDALYADGPLDPTLFRRATHLRALFFETLRMYVLVPGLPFRTTRETSILGYRVPSGRRVIVTPIPSHFSAEHFDNPQAFDVQRCMAPRRENRTRSFAPYGMPPRICAAAGMVEIHVLTAVSALLHTVDLRLERPTYRTDLTLRPLLSPTDGLPVVIRGQRTPSAGASRALLLQREADMTSALGDEALPGTAPQGTPVFLRAGETVLHQGDEADAFYVIVNGEVDVTREAEDPALTGAEHLARLVAGQTFGEVGLLKACPRTATVKAATDVHLLRIERDDFLRLVSDVDLTGQELGLELQRRYVKSMLAAAMPRIAPEELARIVPEFELRAYAPGQDVIVQGGLDEYFYVVVAGTADVILERGDGTQRRVNRLDAGDYFGEIALLQNRPRTSTVRAAEGGVLTVIRTSRAQFEELLDCGGNVRADLHHVICRRLMTNLEAATAATGSSAAEPGRVESPGEP